MDGFALVSIQLPYLLPDHVLPYALEYLSCIRRSKSETDCYAVLDIQTALALGLSRNFFLSGNRTVCIWILQHHADLYSAWPYHNGILQATQLVCILPDGKHDANDL